MASIEESLVVDSDRNVGILIDGTLRRLDKPPLRDSMAPSVLLVGTGS